MGGVEPDQIRVQKLDFACIWTRFSDSRAEVRFWMYLDSIWVDWGQNEDFWTNFHVFHRFYVPACSSGRVLNFRWKYRSDKETAQKSHLKTENQMVLPTKAFKNPFISRVWMERGRGKERRGWGREGGWERGEVNCYEDPTLPVPIRPIASNSAPSFTTA